MTEETQNQNEQELQQQGDSPSVSSAGAAIPNISFNRKFRRMLLKQSGYVKLKNRLGYKDWFENVQNNIQTGKQLHATNTEEAIRRFIDAAEKRNESIAASLLERGYSEELAAKIMERNMEVNERISIKKMKQ